MGCQDHVVIRERGDEMVDDGDVEMLKGKRVSQEVDKCCEQPAIAAFALSTKSVKRCGTTLHINTLYCIPLIRLIPRVAGGGGQNLSLWALGNAEQRLRHPTRSSPYSLQQIAAFAPP